MITPLLLKGLTIGVSIAAPVGPIGLLCIRRAISEGARAGFICGLGAATADAAYALIGGFAMTAAARWLVAEQPWFGLIGGLFLVYLGMRTIAARGGEAAAAPARGALSAYSSTLLLTLANPMTIMSFAAVFAGLGVAVAADYSAAALLVGGVFAGSALWWLLLSGIAGRAQRHISAATMRAINRVCGAIIAAFGCYAITGAALAFA
ncbi:MAG TPA: LysE family transporter [Steroidobacteraceae bacterium]|nr:LysE family transporter [Steroidobacteraceae bacterium]